MDNSEAYHSNLFRDYAADNCIELLLQPDYSCEFNIQERVWAKIKLEYRRLINLEKEREAKVKLHDLIKQAFSQVEV